jgi:hypothetical protein
VKRVPLNHLLPALSCHVRDVMLRYAAPNCCIATTAVLKRAMTHFHYTSTPVPVELFVENAEMMRAVDSGAVIPTTEPEREEWFEMNKAYAIGVTRNSPGDFAGHLVLAIPGILIDASLNQCDRPLWNIRLPKMATIRTIPEFYEGKALACVMNGSRVTYRKIIDSAWRTAPDWTSELHYREALNLILKRTEVTLVEHGESGTYPIDP